MHLRDVEAPRILHRPMCNGRERERERVRAPCAQDRCDRRLEQWVRVLPLREADQEEGLMAAQHENW